MRYLFGFLCVCALGLMPLMGCSETAGTGGSGGDGGSAGMAGSGGGGGGGSVDPCTTAQCDSDPARKDACEIGVEYCKSLGAGGAGGAPTEGQCDMAGRAFCNLDTGAGGAGGNPGNCDWTAEQVCVICKFTGGPVQDACEVTFGDCVDSDLGGNECEKCAVAALVQCLEEEL